MRHYDESTPEDYCGQLTARFRYDGMEEFATTVGEQLIVTPTDER
jgi:hypothetical protein